VRNEPIEQIAKWLLLCFALALLSGEVSAEDAQRSAQEQLAVIVVNPRSDFTKIGRAKLVRLVAAYCRDVLNVLPTNTPQEDARVEAEGNTTDLAKINRLVATPQYNRYKARDIFSTCEERAKEAIRVQGVADRTEMVIRQEAGALVSLALIFQNSSDVQLYASRAGLNVNALGFDFIAAVERSLLVAALRSLENK
jgi:hypothetical protein